MTPSAHPPLTPHSPAHRFPFHRGSPWPLPAQVISRCVRHPNPQPHTPHLLALKCLFVRQISGRKKNSCLEDVFNSVDVMSMFSSVCSEPDLAHPKQKHKGSFLVLHNILLGLFPFFFFKKKNKQKKLVFNLFMDSSVRLTIPL